MKIDSFNVQQSSTHKLQKSRNETEHIEIRTGGGAVVEPSYTVDIKGRSYGLTADKTQQSSDKLGPDDTDKDPRIKLIESFVYLLTGKKIKFDTPKIEQSYKETPSITLTASGVTPDASNWGMVYEYQQIVTEQESVRFESGGYVTTADGRTIAFNLEFEMSRAFYQRINLTLRMGNEAKAVDPLVVVFDNGLPTLTSSRHAFDIDANGTADQIAFTTGNSGFLALDKNGDGIINDGTELFGPQSGNGFTELAQYDFDRNGWIDENDEIYERLMLLTMTQEGEKTLFKLGDMGIGAIYLNDISTQFSLIDESDHYGDMKSSSVFIRENGTAGTIHHIDLSI